MISIIICSRSPNLLKQVSDNVAKTIGVSYEIIAIDNVQGKYGICTAYNLGAQQSKYNILCFMHEDILFQSQNWGGIIENILLDKTIGLVGVIGSKYLVEAPAPWWGGGIELCRRNIVEGYADNTEEKILQNPDNEKLSDVVAVDGLWLCTRKEVWQSNKFDEKTFSHFHFYDMDFSAQIYQTYRVVVTFDILIKHFSRGNMNQSWVNSALLFKEKWHKYLPMSTLVINHDENIPAKAKSFAYQSFASLLISLRFNRYTTLKYILKSLYHNNFNRDNLWLFKQFVKKLYSL